MPLGAGALAGVNYPLDRAQVAAELGFDRVAPNAMDAVAAATPPSNICPSSPTAALTLSRLAEEWCSGAARSSAWPRSRSRGRRARASCRRSATPTGRSWSGPRRRLPARLQGLGALLKGLPLAYNKDLQEDKLYVFASREELDLCLEAMTAMVGALPSIANAARRRPKAATLRRPMSPTISSARACPSAKPIAVGQAGRAYWRPRAGR